jgi:PAS domain S-box-containing protein
MGAATYESAEEIKICKGDIDYQGIVKHINDGVVIIVEGKIVFANDAFCSMTQKDPAFVLNSDFSNYVRQTDQEKVMPYLRERLFAHTLPDSIEFVMPGAHHESAIIEMKVSVISCAGSPAILAALTDITERRKIRLDLNRVKERLESILHSMNEVVVSFSVQADYAITSINPAAEALYGVPLREFTSGEKHTVDFVHPDDVDKVNRFYLGLPDAEFDQAEYRIISSNGEVKWVLDEGHVVFTKTGNIRRIDHVIRDITEGKKAADALRQSEEKYRDFFSSTSDMAFILTPGGHFMDINEAGVKLLGFKDKEEALKSNVEDFYLDISERTALLDELYGQGRVVGKHVKFRDLSGEAIEVAVTARVKTDESGKLLYHEGIIHNITKALEDQRNRVLRNAAGGLCHYLNTHLMQLLSSQDAVSEDIELLADLIANLADGASPKDTAALMNQAIVEARHFAKSAKKAYEKISEVTRAFNKAFYYHEEAYLSDTILDIFKTYGYEGSK